MGCFESKASEVVSTKAEKFSWDQEERPDPKNFMLSGITHGVHGRLPGEVKGQQFVIEDCSECLVYLLDTSATVLVDNCERCKIFIGPVKGSLFLRNCKDVQVVCACQQFRSRDCRRVDVFLHCATQPIIESSSSMKFACFQGSYAELADQFRQAELSVFNNHWSNVHDFTPIAEHSNWSLLPEDSKAEDFVPIPLGDKFVSVHFDCDPRNCLVPVTRGSRHPIFDETCLVALFADCTRYGKSFVDDVIERGCSLVQSKEITMTDDDIKRVFMNGNYVKLSGCGTVIGFEVCGQDVIDKCEKSMKILGISRDKVYISSSQTAAHRDVDAFYKFVDMTLS